MIRKLYNRALDRLIAKSFHYSHIYWEKARDAARSKDADAFTQISFMFKEAGFRLGRMSRRPEWNGGGKSS